MPRVLIVEDHDDIREMLAEMLRLEGIEALEAANGAEALTILDQIAEPPDLILLDLMMPVMDGIEFLRHFEQRGLLGRIPVVVVSAGGQASQVPQASKFVRKPPSNDLILQLVRDLCVSRT